MLRRPAIRIDHGELTCNVQTCISLLVTLVKTIVMIMIELSMMVLSAKTLTLFITTTMAPIGRHLVCGVLRSGCEWNRCRNTQRNICPASQRHWTDFRSDGLSIARHVGRTDRRTISRERRAAWFLLI